MARRGGRPRRAHPRSRPTTRQGRRPALDPGTPELQRLRTALVGKNDLSLDPLGALLARELITRQGYNVGNLYAALSALSRKGWRIEDGSLSAHYRKVVANGFGLLGDAPGVWAGTDLDRSYTDRIEAARTRLDRMNRALWLPGESSVIYHTTRATVLDQLWADWLKHYVLGKSWPKDERRLEALREGLRRLREA
jgi:hypothetical protein